MLTFSRLRGAGYATVPDRRKMLEEHLTEVLSEIETMRQSADALQAKIEYYRWCVFIRGLATPTGLSFDTRGRLLIGNRRTNQILAAQPDGKIEVVAEELQAPVGAVELPNGDLLVSNIEGGVSLVSPHVRVVVASDRKISGGRRGQ
ncbi:hypothetical protein ACQFN5_30125 (plasmid) [Klebsiella sp. WOUb02]|uniref:hypothetical protein n=1 Tax=Klebsiella sp. WOUb02 TaxID=3161071 RepID=UPI003CF51923